MGEGGKALLESKYKEAGAKTGDTVILDDFEFEYFE